MLLAQLLDGALEVGLAVLPGERALVVVGLDAHVLFLERDEGDLLLAVELFLEPFSENKLIKINTNLKSNQSQSSPLNFSATAKFYIIRNDFLFR